MKRTKPITMVEAKIIQSDEDEERQAEEDRLRQSQPWNLLHSLDRALFAVKDVADRVRSQGEEADTRILLQIVFHAIRALDASPNARERMRQAKEWPTFVPGGLESGPLRKAWAKQFELRRVGEDNPDAPRKGSVHLEMGTPAWLAMTVFKELEKLRISGPLPVEIASHLESVSKAEPEYMTKARSLRLLSEATASEWRDLAVITLESRVGDWKWWIQFLPGREQTMKGKLQKKADKGAGLRVGQADEFDAGIAKSMVSAALLEGFLALAKLR